MGKVDFAAAERWKVLAVRELRVLRAITRGEAHEVRTLSVGFGISKPAVTRAFDALCEKGLAMRVTVPEDRRLVRLVPTDKGAKASQEIFP